MDNQQPNKVKNMEKKFTPGPWELTTVPFELMNADNAATIYGKFNNDGSPLIAGISRSPGDEEAINNARLIAVAPELLQAVENLVWAIEYYSERGVRIDTSLTEYNSAKQVIKKALTPQP